MKKLFSENGSLVFAGIFGLLIPLLMYGVKKTGLLLALCFISILTCEGALRFFTSNKGSASWSLSVDNNKRILNTLCVASLKMDIQQTLAFGAIFVGCLFFVGASHFVSLDFEVDILLRTLSIAVLSGIFISIMHWKYWWSRYWYMEEESTRAKLQANGYSSDEIESIINNLRVKGLLQEI